MAIKLICSDCNGVLNNVDGDYSKSGFYSTIANENEELYRAINEFLFRGGSKHLGRAWMAGEISYTDLNTILSLKFNCEYSYLNSKLEESARLLELNWDLIKIYQRFRKNNIKVVITSDNMDIFSRQTVPHNKLNDYFDEIYNSSDLKHLKEENEFELYRKLANKYGLNTKEVLIVDDGQRLIRKARKLGFSAYLYNQNTCDKFESWMNQHI